MSNPEIEHDAQAARFSTVVDGREALLEYLRGDGAITITHTGVPMAIGGRGIAAALVLAAFEYARAAGLKVVPQCAYAAAWVRRHPQHADLVA